MLPDASRKQVVYASYDVFPSPKGAATHIDAFARALGRRFRSVDLVTVQSSETNAEFCYGLAEKAAWNAFDRPRETRWSAQGVTHHGLPATGRNLFERVRTFRTHFWNWWKRRNGLVADVLHFRSIFEGYPIARNKASFCRRIVYEVNGLPSIELKYHYPRVADDFELMRKLRSQEDVCLRAADLVLTVSHVTADYLMSRGVDKGRIAVIPNGVHADRFGYICPASRFREVRTNSRPMRVLYSGTFALWQGVIRALEGVALYRRDYPATLTLVGPMRRDQERRLRAYAKKLDMESGLHIAGSASRNEVVDLHHSADVSLAPLVRNDRNAVQGCCPLKVLEAMASGTPLVASDLPVVRELVTADREAILVRPNSGKAIKDGLLRLRNEAGLAESVSRHARRKIVEAFEWSNAQERLLETYARVGCEVPC